MAYQTFTPRPTRSYNYKPPSHTPAKSFAYCTISYYIPVLSSPTAYTYTHAGLRASCTRSVARVLIGGTRSICRCWYHRTDWAFLAVKDTPQTIYATLTAAPFFTISSERASAANGRALERPNSVKFAIRCIFPYTHILSQNSGKGKSNIIYTQREEFRYNEIVLCKWWLNFEYTLYSCTRENIVLSATWALVSFVKCSLSLVLAWYTAE